MAKIVVAGEAVVITSTMRLDELRTIKKYRPEALCLKDEEGEPIFCIGVTTGAGAIGKYGAEFGAEGHGDEPKACITMVCPGISGDVKEAVSELIGPAILRLNEIEDTLPAVLEEIVAEKAAIEGTISVAE